MDHAWAYVYYCEHSYSIIITIIITIYYYDNNIILRVRPVAVSTWSSAYPKNIIIMVIIYTDDKFLLNINIVNYDNIIHLSVVDRG